MKKILLSLSVVSFLCAGNFGDFDKFDDNFDRFMNGHKKTKENKQEQKATGKEEDVEQKEEKADVKKIAKEKQEQKVAIKNIVQSFKKESPYYSSGRGRYGHHDTMYIEYGFDSNGGLNSIIYSLHVNEIDASGSAHTYKSWALQRLPLAIQDTLDNGRELKVLKNELVVANKNGADKAMASLKNNIQDTLKSIKKDPEAIEIINQNFDTTEETYYIKLKVKDDIIQQANKSQAIEK